MEQSKIKVIVENYLTDHNIYDYVNLESEIIPIQDVLFNEVINILHHVRDYDDDFLYDEFNNMHLFQQQKLICTLLDQICINNNDNILNEGVISFLVNSMTNFPLTSGIVGLIIAGLSFKFRTSITKGASKFIAKIGKLSEEVGKFLVKHGRYNQFNYAIIQQNSEKCYKNCGIPNISKINFLSYFNTKNVDEQKFFETAGPCLSRCYITAQIEISMMLLRLYLICLKNTNQFDNIGKLNDTQIYTLFLHPEESKPKNQFILSGSCEDYFKLASKNFNTFNDLLDYVYLDTKNKHEAMSRLYSQIKQVKNEVQQTNINILNKKYR